MAQCQKSWQGRRFVNPLKRGRKNIPFLSVVKILYRKNSQEIINFQLQNWRTRNAFFGASNSQVGRSFLRFAEGAIL